MLHRLMLLLYVMIITLDIRLQGIGKLQLHPGCTGYSPHTLLYGNTVVGNTSLQLEGDFHYNSTLMTFVVKS